MTTHITGLKPMPVCIFESDRDGNIRIADIKIDYIKTGAILLETIKAKPR